MAIRNIVKEGDPILNKVCRPVTTFDDRLATLLDDMHETMIAADGVGLAGPQVGMLRRLFVVWDTTDAPEEIPENSGCIRGRGDRLRGLSVLSGPQRRCDPPRRGQGARTGPPR